MPCGRSQDGSFEQLTGAVQDLLADLTEDAVQAYLEPHIVKWWKPDKVIFDSVPLTATGKIDKMRLRVDYGGC